MPVKLCKCGCARPIASPWSRYSAFCNEQRNKFRELKLCRCCNKNPRRSKDDTYCVSCDRFYRNRINGSDWRAQARCAAGVES
jgi:hypothetical protein